MPSERFILEFHYLMPASRSMRLSWIENNPNLSEEEKNERIRRVYADEHEKLSDMRRDMRRDLTNLGSAEFFLIETRMKRLSPLIEKPKTIKPQTIHIPILESSTIKPTRFVNYPVFDDGTSYCPSCGKETKNTLSGGTITCTTCYRTDILLSPKQAKSTSYDDLMKMLKKLNK